ncbi:MAG: grpE 1, partial [Myxococcales bacterium]|nr:grpE 1 [Myxococcales bacterium]
TSMQHMTNDEQFPTEPARAGEPDRATMTRALRDLEAAQARVERDAQRVFDETRTKLVQDLLPVLDNVDRSIRAGVENGDAPAVVEGVRLVRAQLEALLVSYGVERVEAKGRLFDPKLHDAIHVAPVRSRADHGLVIEQIEPGFRFGDRLLRPAKVVVGRALAFAND